MDLNKCWGPPKVNFGTSTILVYINDIVLDIDSTICMFADDTSLYMIVDNPLHTAITLNQDLAKISTWADKWLVTFNTQETESLLISRKINKPIHPPIVMNNDHITEVDNHKHLGVVFENTCTWHLIISKAWQRIYTMRKLKFILDIQSLQAIYISFIRPILEYADVAWTNCTKYEEDELEKIQIEAARIVIGSTKFVSISNLYEET